MDSDSEDSILNFIPETPSYAEKATPPPNAESLQETPHLMMNKTMRVNLIQVIKFQKILCNIFTLLNRNVIIHNIHPSYPSYVLFQTFLLVTLILTVNHSHNLQYSPSREILKNPEQTKSQVNTFMTNFHNYIKKLLKILVDILVCLIKNIF